MSGKGKSLPPGPIPVPNPLSSSYSLTSLLSTRTFFFAILIRVILSSTTFSDWFDSTGKYII